MFDFGKSEWICRQDDGGFDSYTSFYFSADIKSGEKTTFYVSAYTDYCLFDGSKMIPEACGQFPAYEDKPVYDEIDLTDVLSPGHHSLRLLLYCGGRDFSTHRATPPAVIFELYCGENLAAKSRTDIMCSSDANFVSGKGVPVSGQLGFTFRYICGFDDSRIYSEHAIKADFPRNFTKRPVKKLVTGKIINESAVSSGYISGAENIPGDSYGLSMINARLVSSDDIPENAAGIFTTTDLHTESAGKITFDIDLSEDAEVLVGWGEHLTDGKCPELPKGRVRAFVGGRNFAFSYRGRKGKNIFTSPLLRSGCRYLEIHIYDRKAKVNCLSLYPTDYPLDNVKNFKLKDEIWQNIFDTSVRTLRLCMHEHYEDCPWREQSLYTMDSRNQMLCGYEVFGETQFAYASLKLAADSLREDNMLELCSPARVPITIPSFTAIFLTQCGEYLGYSGDTDGIRELLPVLFKTADGFIAHTDKSKGLIPCFAEECYWNFYEWQDGLEGSISGSIPEDKITFDAPLNAFVILGLNSLSSICEKLGDLKNSEKYKKAAERLSENAEKTFWDESKSAYASFCDKSDNLSHFCELTNSLILFCGIAPSGRAEKVLSHLDSGDLVPVTLSHSIFKYSVLLSSGKNKEKTVSEIRNRWNKMLMCGATSFWETDEGESAFDNAGSLCHGWSAIPVYLLTKYCPELFI